MRVFFSGIGGVGIGPLALIAKDAGHEVIGSDASASRYTELMKDHGIEVIVPQTADRLRAAHADKPLDWFVYTAALPSDHPELKTAKDLGIKTTKRDEFLNILIEQHQLKLIAASGTHGKTTTTGMLVWLFKELNQPVSYSIGTNISFGDSGRFDPASQYFIYEADEYDKNMLKFSPFVSVITSVDYDHPDTYRDESDYLLAFREFIAKSHCAFLWREDAEKIGGLPAGCVHTYGKEEDLDIIKLAGHNRRNGFLAVQCVHALFPEVPLSRLAEIIARFPGTERRFERLKDNLYTDYAHHPVEIASTIDLAREQNPKVVVVYQPHQNLRQQDLLQKKGYASAFNKAAQVYWLPTYLSREPVGVEAVSPEDLIATLDDPSLAQTAKLDDELAADINRHLQAGDLVLIMGAGDVDAWARSHLI